jgi:hypothetical protein
VGSPLRQSAPRTLLRLPQEIDDEEEERRRRSVGVVGGGAVTRTHRRKAQLDKAYQY